MSNTIYTHYAYRITNVFLKKHYYGSRSCKCQPKDDLGIKYFSSSTDKDFIKDQKENPDHYRYKIIKICENRNDVLELEILLHEKFNVGINEKFYNRSKQTSTRFYYDWTGRKHIEDTKKKISKLRKGKKRSKETLKNMSETQKGKKRSEKTKKKISEATKGEKNPFYGKNHSEESRMKMSKSKNGKKSAFYGKRHSEKARKKISEAKKGEKNHQFKGYYVTPFGNFTSSKDEQIKENNIGNTAFKKWCKNNNTIISKKSYECSKYLRENFDKSIIGKTFADIGFSFIEK